MTETRKQPGISKPSKRAAKAAAAAENVCRTTPIGDIKGFATCLNEGLASCPHRKPFGYGHLCYHPQWKQFLPEAKP